jgi:hypothetical protein
LFGICYPSCYPSSMKLLERFQQVASRRRLAVSTRDCYWNWIVEFLRFHRTNGIWRPPGQLTGTHVEAFLNDLALRKMVSAVSARSRGGTSGPFRIRAGKTPAPDANRPRAGRDRRVPQVGGTPQTCAKGREPFGAPATRGTRQKWLTGKTVATNLAATATDGEMRPGPYRHRTRLRANKPTPPRITRPSEAGSGTTEK